MGNPLKLFQDAKASAPQLQFQGPLLLRPHEQSLADTPCDMHFNHGAAGSWPRGSDEMEARNLYEWYQFWVIRRHLTQVQDRKAREGMGLIALHDVARQPVTKMAKQQHNMARSQNRNLKKKKERKKERKMVRYSKKRQIWYFWPLATLATPVTVAYCRSMHKRLLTLWACFSVPFFLSRHPSERFVILQLDLFILPPPPWVNRVVQGDSLTTSCRSPHPVACRTWVFVDLLVRESKVQ